MADPTIQSPSTFSVSTLTRSKERLIISHGINEHVRANSIFIVIGGTTTTIDRPSIRIMNIETATILLETQNITVWFVHTDSRMRISRTSLQGNAELFLHIGEGQDIGQRQLIIPDCAIPIQITNQVTQ